MSAAKKDQKLRPADVWLAALKRAVARLDQHYNAIMWTISGVLLVLAVAVYWRRSSQAAEAGGWKSLFAVVSGANPAGFNDVVQDHPGTSAARWAMLIGAEDRLRTGSRAYFRNREESIVDLKLAEEGFRALVDDAKAPPEVLERALFGLACARECLSDGDTKAAQDTFDRFLKEYPNSRFKDEAESRLAALKRESAGEFYAWASKLNPKPDDAPQPRDRGIGSGLNIPSSLLPGSGDPVLHPDPPGGAPEETGGTPAKKKQDDEKPDDEKKTDGDNPLRPGPELPSGE